jgi:cytochrome b
MIMDVTPSEALSGTVAGKAVARKAAGEGETMTAPRTVLVWDFPTRAFHWLLVLAVVVSYATGGEEGWLFVVHTASGYLVVLLLLFRLLWGVIGSEHSLFRDFVHGPQIVGGYVRRLLVLDPPRYVGHNPLGGWMVILILVVLALTVATGALSGEEDGPSGPLLWLIAAPGGEGLAEVHEVLANLVVVLAIVHVCGVLVDWWLTGENLVSAMISGVKRLDETAAAAERPPAPAWRMIVAAGLVVLVGAVLVAKTDFAKMATTEGQHSENASEIDD